MKSFLAIELSDEIRGKLAALQETFQREGLTRGFRWVPAANLHLTLRFFGEIEPADVVVVEQAMRFVAEATAPLRLTCRGLGCFPNAFRPRVLWAGVQDEGDLGDFSGRLIEATRSLGQPPDDREFNPHVTLARIREGAWKREEAMADALAPYGNETFGGWRPRRVVLMESKPGPEYEVRAEAPLR
jgi:RNA 2',3'-cyclic 3'-phosphodiesterase